MTALVTLTLSVAVTILNWGNTRITDTAILFGMVAGVHLLARLAK